SSSDAVPQLLTRFEHITSSEPMGGGLRKLNELLAAITTLHSQLPLESVLGEMLTYAISVTDADRGVLLGPDAGKLLKVRRGRRSGGSRLPPASPAPSQTAIQLAPRHPSPVTPQGS